MDADFGCYTKQTVKKGGKMISGYPIFLVNFKLEFRGKLKISHDKFSSFKEGCAVPD